MAAPRSLSESTLAGLPEELRRFLRDDVQVRLTTRDGRPAVELSQVVRQPDGKEETQAYTLDLQAEPLPGPREPGRKEEPAPGQTYHAVGFVSAVDEDRAEFKVTRAFTDLDKATLYRDKHRLALFPGAHAEEPARGATLELGRHELEALQLKGKGQDLAYQIRVLRWKAEQGQYHNVGLWNDRDEAPRVGQLVHFTSGRDFRGEPEERRVTPLRPVDPGPPKEPQLVVFEMSRRTPNFGRIVSLPNGPEEAQADLRAFDAKKLFDEQADLQGRWRTFDAAPRLRVMAGRRNGQAGARKPVQPEPVQPVTITTHRKGHARADVVTRMGEGGKVQRTIVLSRDVRQPDGRVRTSGVVLTFAEAREIRRIYEQARRERAAGRAPAPERGREADPGRSARYAAYLEHQAREQQRQNKLGVWMGAEPPKKNDAVRWESGTVFDPKTGAVLEKPGRVYPVDGAIRVDFPKEPLYVACEREGGPFHKVAGFTRNLELARERVAEREAQHRAKSRADLKATCAEVLDLVDRHEPTNERLKARIKQLLSSLGPEPMTPHRGPAETQQVVQENGHEQRPAQGPAMAH